MFVPQQQSMTFAAVARRALVCSRAGIGRRGLPRGPLHLCYVLELPI